MKLERSGNKVLLTPLMSARVSFRARYNTLNAWCEKTDHHFDRDQEGNKRDKPFSGMLPNTANALETFSEETATRSPRAHLHQGPPQIPGQRLNKHGFQQLLRQRGNQNGLQQRLRLRRNKHIFRRLLRLRASKHVLRKLLRRRRNKHVLRVLLRLSENCTGLCSVTPRLLHIG